MTPIATNRKIASWLFICCLMVALMVLIGGLTRLTESGLSMTDWHPIHGVIPPLNEAEWQEEFTQYKTFPEYQKKNAGMSLDAFKTIFYVEYFHRILGRITGFVFLLPFLYFAFTNQMSMRLSKRLFGLFCLGGLQGVIGWYMVQSGLVDVPSVSQYRLTLHLLMAFLLFGLLFRQGLQCWYGEYRTSPTPTTRYSSILLAILVFQIAYGGLVAGLDAGMLHNTFPTMDGEWIPSGMWFYDPWYINLFENHTTVQFIHRLGSFAVVIAALFCVVQIWNDAHRSRGLAQWSLFLLIAVLLQWKLGLLTLLWQVPVDMASAHQMVALVLLMCVLGVHYFSYDRSAT